MLRDRPLGFAVSCCSKKARLGRESEKQAIDFCRRELAAVEVEQIQLVVLLEIRFDLYSVFVKKRRQL